MKPLCIVSVILNLLFILFLALSLSGKTASVSVPAPGPGYTTGICAASAPETGNIIFSPVAFSLRTGEEAALQYSVLHEGKQVHISIDPLYDRDIVSVEKTLYGLRIYALKPGEAVLQFLTAEGIRDIAVVTVVSE